MRESIGGAWLFQIVILLILLFTAYLCLSINYTSAYKVTDSVINQIQKDNGVNSENIKGVLSEAGYKSQGKCNAGSESGWTPMNFDGAMMDKTTDAANYCIKKVKVANATDELPEIYYYRVKVFYKIEVPIISSFNFNVQADSANIYEATDDLRIGNIEVIGD